MADEVPYECVTRALRLTGNQFTLLQDHLFPSDGKEAVALALCGQASRGDRDSVRRVGTVHRLHLVPHEACTVREKDRVVWSTERLPELLKEAAKRNLFLLKIHSHPNGFEHFSRFDDSADRELFEGASGWLDTYHPGISAIMLPGGRIVARSVSAYGEFAPVDRVLVAGPDIQIWDRSSNPKLRLPVRDLASRTRQAFGDGTTELLSRLSVGVVGCSGTGSPVVEQLYRLGVGELVLVDPETIGHENLGRIYNSTVDDAEQKRSKVHVLADAIRRSGLPTAVVPIAKDLRNPEVVRRLAQCDVVFGCMDSVDGRDLLNRLASYYCIPYFDVGVRLDADGNGGVEQVCGTVHYLQPDGSSLLSRGVYTIDDLAAASLRRDDPEMYAQQAREGYVHGAAEVRPAVISVNTLAASYAVDDLLARLHPFRDEPNENSAALRFSLSQSRFLTEPEGSPCQVLAPKAGRGDARVLLDSPSLSER